MPSLSQVGLFSPSREVARGRSVQLVWTALLVGVFLFAHASVTASFRSAEAAESTVPDLSDREGPVRVILVEGTIDPGLAAYVRRAVHEALKAGASLLLVKINTFGGRVDAATEIRDALVGANIPTAAYIPERAWSAGALISLACDTIWMSPGSSIGAAEPRPNDPKVVSALRAEFEAMAERTGRNPRVAAAMVDQSVAIEGVINKGDILTLTAEQAQKLGYADGVAFSRGDVVGGVGLAGRVVEVSEANWGERVARFLTDPLVSEILLAVAVLGVIAELATPGLGVGGLSALIALGLFFGGRGFVGLVGWEVIGLFLLGILLLLIELFVVPGFGVAGLGGLLAVFASFFYSFADSQQAGRSLIVALITAGLGLFLLWRYGRRHGLWRGLILGARQSEEEGYVAPNDLQKYRGRSGRSLTVLRPAGAIEVEGERVDAVSEGGFIPAGRPVSVVRVEGTRVVVREI